MRKLIVIMVFLLITTPILAEEQAKTGADPTDFITRIEPSYEFKRIHQDKSRNDTTDLNFLVVRGDLALRPDLSLRVDLPLAHINPGDTLSAAGFDDQFGLGDMVTQILHKPYSSQKGAFLYGLRLDLPTATEDELAAGGLTVAPIAVGALFPKPKWIVAGVAQWFLADDLDNDPLAGERDRNELSLRPIVIYQPMKPYMSWINLDPDLKIDFEKDNETKLNIGVEYGKMVSKTSAFFIKPSANVGGGDEGWGIKVGMRFMFPGKYFFD